MKKEKLKGCGQAITVAILSLALVLQAAPAAAAANPSAEIPAQKVETLKHESGTTHNLVDLTYHADEPIHAKEIKITSLYSLRIRPGIKYLASPRRIHRFVKRDEYMDTVILDDERGVPQNCPVKECGETRNSFRKVGLRRMPEFYFSLLNEPDFDVGSGVLCIPGSDKTSLGWGVGRSQSFCLCGSGKIHEGRGLVTEVKRFSQL